MALGQLTATCRVYKKREPEPAFLVLFRPHADWLYTAKRAYVAYVAISRRRQ